MTTWVDGVSGQDKSLRGESLGLRKSGYHLCSEVADVPQCHLLRHPTEAEGPGNHGEPQRVAPAADEVDAALRLPHGLLRGLVSSRRGAPRGIARLRCDTRTFALPLRPLGDSPCPMVL